jgi:hypothetical protein
MDPTHESTEPSDRFRALPPESSQHRFILRTVYLAAALLAFCGLGLFALRERGHSRDLEAARIRTTAELAHAQNQIGDLSKRIDGLTSALNDQMERERAAEAARAAAQAANVQAQQHTVASTRPRPRKPAEDPRYKALQSQVTQQQQELAQAREDLNKTQQDLQSSINSTRDDLNGSIAKTHDELIALEKRGERNYYEFHLSKSKAFQRIGPVGLGLRKANTKRHYSDLAMMVDDQQLDKKHVNLYEPIWISLGDHPQPVELVINRIDKDSISGYVSEPKYRKSELAGTQGPASAAQQQPQPAPDAQPQQLKQREQ